MRAVVVPKFAVLAGLAVTAFVIGASIAWIETGILLGALPAGRALIGIATGALLELFIVAVVVYAAGRSANFIQAAVFAVVVIFAMPLLENVAWLGAWLPSRLAANLLDLDKQRDAFDYARPVLVTLIAVPALLALGIRAMDNREV
jgi:hypothetical protein